jgi:hypothetical protein
MPMRTYLEASRQPRYSLLFAAPLLLGYELLAWLLSHDGIGLRNGADVLLKWLFASLGGPRGVVLFGVLLIGFGAWLVVRDLRQGRERLQPHYFALMLLESSLLAILVGVVVGRATQALLEPLSISQLEQTGIATRLMLSLGAGLYEELLFRVIIVGLLSIAGRRLLGWSPLAAGVAACVLGALIFSGFHYVGAYGDQLELGSFVFRTLAGLVFSALYLTRGFGITAWTHALYDVYVLLG